MPLPSQIAAQFAHFFENVCMIACGDVILFQNHREGQCPSPTEDVSVKFIFITQLSTGVIYGL